MTDIAALVADNLDIWASSIERKSGAGRGGGGKRISLYGIERLRALIFDLAAAGKLITGPILQPEKLGKHVDLVMGQAPPGNACNTNGDGTIFVKTGEFGPRYPEIREWTTKPLKFAKSGDVLICVVGATIGKLNLAIDCAIGRSVAAIRPKPSLETNYLYYALMPFTLRLRIGARGSAQGVIGKAELNAVSIRVPPLAEQRRIVAKVDELMALCDALERESAGALAAHQTLVETLLTTLVNSVDAAELAANWARLESHFDTLFTTEASIGSLKQTVLDLAVRGKLVEQDARDEAADKMLSHLASEKMKSGKPGKDRASTIPHVADTEVPFGIPLGWAWARFSQVAEIRAELVQSVDFPDAVQIAPDVIEKGSGKLITIRTVAEAGVRGPNNRFYAGQIIYSKIRPSLSKAVIAECDGLCSADMYPLDARIDTNFLLRLILSEPFLQQVRIAENRIKMPKLNKESLNAFVVPIPPLAEQRRIVAKVDELMVLCDAMKVRLADAAETRRHLADAIVERAAA